MDKQRNTKVIPCRVAIAHPLRMRGLTRLLGHVPMLPGNSYLRCKPCAILVLFVVVIVVQN
eukprot:5704646-Amphidinium_carterae.4